jgi:hypothetical protein
MNDAGQPEPSARPPRFEIPEIVGLVTRRIEWEPRRLRNFASALDRRDQAIEFTVETSDPLPLDDDVVPVLYVGDAMVTEMRVVDKNQYVFIAHDERRLEANAPIALGYPGTPIQARARTERRFEPPDRDARPDD